MTSIAIAAFAAALLWSCAAAAATDSPAQDVQVSTAEGPSLNEITRTIEVQGFQTFGALFDLFGSWMTDDGSAEARGKKPKPMKMAMMMAGSAAAGMMAMKAMGAIKLFIIHSFLATKLGLIIGAYLLLCKMMEMKQAPAKKVVKWVSPPSHFDEQPLMAPMAGPYPESQSSYEPHMMDQQQQQQPADQYGPPPQQQYMPSGDFNGGGGGGGSTGGGGDLQAHYSHVSPVTYRPMINRGQQQPDIKSGSAASGRIQK